MSNKEKNIRSGFILGLFLLFALGFLSCDYNANVPDFIKKSVYLEDYKTIYYSPNESDNRIGNRGWSILNPSSDVIELTAIWTEKYQKEFGISLTVVDDVRGEINGLTNSGYIYLDFTVFDDWATDSNSGPFTLRGNPTRPSPTKLDGLNVYYVGDFMRFNGNFSGYIFENLHFVNNTQISGIILPLSEDIKFINCIVEEPVNVNSTFTASGNTRFTDTVTVFNGTFTVRDSVCFEGTIILNENNDVEINVQGILTPPGGKTAVLDLIGFSEGDEVLEGDNLDINCSKFTLLDDTWEIRNDGTVGPK